METPAQLDPVRSMDERVRKLEGQLVAAKKLVSVYMKQLADKCGEAKRLRAIVPKTADGVLASEDMQLWHPNHGSGKVLIVAWLDEPSGDILGASVGECYSTREAAEAAKEKA